MIPSRKLSFFTNICKSLIPQSWTILRSKKALTYEIVLPQKVSKPNEVPYHIKHPGYANCEEESAPNFTMPKSLEEIESIRSSCQLAKQILNAAEKHIKVGMTTDELDIYIHNLIIKYSAYPSPLHYQGFPKSICTSVNNVVCHGIPDDRPLADGDIVSVDVTVYFQGFHGDCAATFLVGEVDEEGRYLVESSEKILLEAIVKCKPGEPLAIIAETISTLAREKGLCVVPAVCGHGIGRYFHELPQIVHDIEYINETDFTERLLPGMVFTIEPVIGEGEPEIIILKDGWTIVTGDDSRAAQFEHTIAITDRGAEILTKL